MVGDAATLGLGGIIRLLATPRVLGAFRVSIVCAALAALTSAVFGLLIAWVLVRTEFPGRRFADAMVDLPFALPTSVAGIALSTLYAPHGWLGALLALLGLRVSFTVVRVIFPVILPALTAGFAMAFARGLGEYGSVIFISSNRPGVSEIVPLLIVNQLEEFDFAGAAAIGTLMLVLSFLFLLAILLLQRAVGPRRHG
jgi:sulfate transport system permease protein